MAIQRSVRLWRARPGAGDSLALPLAEGRAAWLQLIDGAITAPLPLQRGDGLGFTEGELTQPLLADASGADLLLFELA
jgi:redox-sensitive bicupin YhaK (pirin superfamily)